MRSKIYLVDYVNYLEEVYKPKPPQYKASTTGGVVDALYFVFTGIQLQNSLPSVQ